MKTLFPFPLLPWCGFVLALGLLTLPLHAQDNALSSDRPGQANSALVVGRGFWQWQSGVQFTQGLQAVQEEQNTLVENVLRFGLTNDLDGALLFNFDGNQSVFANEVRQEAGISTWGLRLRHASWQGEGWFKAIGWQFDLLLPAIREFSQGNELGSMWTSMLEFQWGDHWGTSVNAGIRWTDGNAALGHFVLNFNKSFDQWSVFAEQYSYQLASGEWPLQWDGGVAYLLNPHWQLDASAGYSRINNNGFYFLNAGFTWRIAPRNS